MKKIMTVLLLGAGPVIAAEESPFVTHTEFGYVNTSGNTNTESFALDFMAKKGWDAHSLKFDFDALYGSENNIENNNKFVTALTYDYQFAEHFTVNYIANYKDDKFSGYDYQWFTGPGLKYIALQGEGHDLSFQLNAVYSSDKEMDKYYTDDTKSTEITYPYPEGRDGAYKDPQSGETVYYGGTLAKLEYLWQINENMKFIQTADYRGDWSESDKYFINSKTALESKMSELLSMGLSYKVAYANKPPEGVEHSDKVFMASLIVDY